MSKIKKILKKIPLDNSIKQFIRRIIKLPYFYFLSSNIKPASNFYGIDRGKPIDRFYIEKFLEENKSFITGNCLEVLNNDYTIKYGEGKIIKSDVIDIESGNKNANIIDDLRDLKKISDNTYDCIILTQVFQFIDDVESAISECYRILKKDGTLLATMPSISRIDCVAGEKGDFWRFTKAGAKYLFQKKFEKKMTDIKSKGNSKVGIYFYTGFAQEDISTKILLKDDENFPLIITVKAQK